MDFSAYSLVNQNRLIHFFADNVVEAARTSLPTARRADPPLRYRTDNTQVGDIGNDSNTGNTSTVPEPATLALASWACWARWACAVATPEAGRSTVRMNGAGPVFHAPTE